MEALDRVVRERVVTDHGWLCLPCGATNAGVGEYCADCGSPRPGPTRWTPYGPGNPWNTRTAGRSPDDDRPRAGFPADDDLPPEDDEWRDEAWDRLRDAWAEATGHDAFPDAEADTAPVEVTTRTIEPLTHPPPALPAGPARPPRGGRVAATMAVIGLLAVGGATVAKVVDAEAEPATVDRQPPVSAQVGPSYSRAAPSPSAPSPSAPSPSRPSPSAPTPSRSPSATPTPTPTRASPTPPPQTIGTVDVRAVSTNPHVRAVGGLYDIYFNGINAKRYAQVLALYDPAGIIDPTDPAQVATFTHGVSTSTDSDASVRSITDDPSGDLLVRVTFRSNQSPGYGPKDAPDETCTLWDITQRLHASPSGDYRILDLIAFADRAC